MSTKELSPTSILNPFEPPRLIKLAHGLLVTLRKLHQREGGWDGETVGNVLVVQWYAKFHPKFFPNFWPPVTTHRRGAVPQIISSTTKDKTY